MYTILTDEDVSRLLSPSGVVAVIEQALKARAEGALNAPPRFSVDADTGSLVFTAGAETKYSQAIGFRVYGTFPDPAGDQQQLVAVYHSRTGGFKGMVIGELVGGLRTAGINAVAIRHMARPEAARLGVLGSGFQAGIHLKVALAVRPFSSVKVYSPNAAHREAFAAGLSAETGIPVEAAGSAEEVVRFADVLICATRSPSPVLEASWVQPGAHINTIGPKFEGMSEVPYELARRSRVIATDSLPQTAAYSKPFFLSGTPEYARIVELGDIVAGKQQGRAADSDITLFCSVGLSGTEVVLADEALRLSREDKG